MVTRPAVISTAEVRRLSPGSAQASFRRSKPPIENTEARTASRAQFTWIILRAKIGVYQNRNFNANWIWRGDPEKVRICPAAAFRPPPPTNKLPPPVPVTGSPRLV